MRPHAFNLKNHFVDTRANIELPGGRGYTSRINEISGFAPFCAQLFSVGMQMVTPWMCCVSICAKSKHILKPLVCCAFVRRKPCHDNIFFYFLCFLVYKPQSNPSQTRILCSKGNSRLPRVKKRNSFEFPFEWCCTLWHGPAQ